MYTLSKQAKVLQANKLHLQVSSRLQALKIPPAMQEQVDVSMKEPQKPSNISLIWSQFVDKHHVQSFVPRWFQRSWRIATDVLQML